MAHWWGTFVVIPTRFIFFLCVTALGAAGSARAQPAAENTRPDFSRSLAQREPLVVGATSDSFPYSFVDEQGQLRGFCVELLDAVARVMNLRIRRVPEQSKLLHERFLAGEFDLLQAYSQAPM